LAYIGQKAIENILAQVESRQKNKTHIAENQTGGSLSDNPTCQELSETSRCLRSLHE